MNWVINPTRTTFCGHSNYLRTDMFMIWQKFLLKTNQYSEDIRKTQYSYCDVITSISPTKINPQGSG